jgi:hypothetical protein
MQLPDATSRDVGISGTIPPSLGHTSLHVIRFTSSYLTARGQGTQTGLSGTLPPTFWNLRTLEYMEFWQTHGVGGTLPSNLGTLMPNLFYLNMHGRDRTRGRECDFGWAGVLAVYRARFLKRFHR